MLERSHFMFLPPDRICTSALAVSDVSCVASARTSCLTAHAATAMRPSGRIATSTSTSDSLTCNSACFRSTSSPCRTYRRPQSQAACAFQRSAFDSGRAGGLIAAAGLRICRPSRRHARQCLQVVAAGGPAGGLGKQRSPRGGEVRIHTRWCVAWAQRHLADTEKCRVCMLQHICFQHCTILPRHFRWTRQARSSWWAWQSHMY